MEAWKRVLLLFKLLMVFLYLTAGVLILFFDVLPSINKVGKMYFGMIIILYGIFRMYTFSLYLKTNHNSIHRSESV